MKTGMMIAAAALLATGAYAQTGAPPADASSVPQTSGDTMGPPASAADSSSMGNAAPMASSDSSTALTKGPDGKWMSGDRPATKSEIAAFKKASNNKPS